MRRLATAAIFAASLLASATIASALFVSGCASGAPADEPVISATEQHAMTVECENDDQYACKSLDDARQAQDERDYRDEPALGYLTTPHGLYLPVPTVSHESGPSQPN